MNARSANHHWKQAINLISASYGKAEPSPLTPPPKVGGTPPFGNRIRLNLVFGPHSEAGTGQPDHLTG